MTKQYNHPMPPLDVAMNRAGQIRRFGDAADGEQKKMVVLADEIERLRSYWTGDKLTGGSDVCHTCQAHCVVIGDKDAEIAQLRRELHQLQNELTAAQLEGERLRNIVTGCPVCSELERNIQPSLEPVSAPVEYVLEQRCKCGLIWRVHAEYGFRVNQIFCACGNKAYIDRDAEKSAPEPNLLSITEAELNAALLPVAKHMNAQLRQYWAMPPKEFAELAWNALIDEMGSEQTNVLYALCARLSPEWEREAEEGAKIDATPQKSLPAHLPNQEQWCQDPNCPQCASQRTGAKHAD